MKRGKEEEKIAAASLSVLVCLQMGNTDAASDAAAAIRPLLAQQMTDAADVGTAARAACALAYGVLSFIFSPETETLATMAKLQAIFTAPRTDAELQAECLEAWSLLLTLVQSNQAVDAVQTVLANYLEAALDSTNVDLRIAAGETYAVIYEVAGEHVDISDDVLDKFKQLSTDTNKSR